jgi:hypothetical protein
VRIEVTVEDIRAGRPGEAGACPVALALCRATGRPWAVCPEELFGRFDGPVRAPGLDAPPEVTTFVLAFDRGEAVSPFSFDLEVERCVSK